MFFRFRRTAPTPPPVATPTNPRACGELDSLPRPFSPLIAEMMALYCHTRPIGALSQSEQCAEEYRLVARSVVHHILEGWQNQTDGRGTIDDLLLEPRRARTPTAPDERASSEHDQRLAA
ncbi:hypothetical protein ACFTTN_31715 [Streptomyces niveus]|uniref:hypothetical protein n=1 Tax=Streptomyces niveus TaxID=193462 RepID=UPI00363D1ABB